MSDGLGAASRGIARTVPGPARAGIRALWCRVQVARARRRWSEAPPSGPLDASRIEPLARRYPVRESAYGYSPDALAARGHERAAQLAPYARSGRAILEIGSADGMTACALAAGGCRVTAVDIDTSRTDARARAAGVTVREMDATRLQLPDASFDLVYSFNVFEHLPDPAATFDEIVRVLRPGGVLSIAFGALRWSPHGAHLYKQIGIPYVTVLFEEADVLEYLRRRGRPVAPPWVNDYSIERFRAVFRRHAAAVPVVRYRETRNRWHAALIAEHAGTFRRRAPSFESLLVDSVHVVARKRPEGAPAARG